MAVLIVVLVVVVVIIGGAVLAYNGLVRRRTRTEEAWSQIDVELKRRHDLIPEPGRDGEGLRRSRAGDV